MLLLQSQKSDYGPSCSDGLIDDIGPLKKSNHSYDVSANVSPCTKGVKICKKKDGQAVVPLQVLMFFLDILKYS